MSNYSMIVSADFKNLYKYPPLLNENLDMEGSRGSIEKLPRANFSRGEFVLWTNGKAASDRVGKNSSPILIPRQRFLRARVTTSEVGQLPYIIFIHHCHANSLMKQLLNQRLIEKLVMFFNNYKSQTKTKITNMSVFFSEIHLGLSSDTRTK